MKEMNYALNSVIEIRQDKKYVASRCIATYLNNRRSHSENEGLLGLKIFLVL